LLCNNGIVSYFSRKGLVIDRKLTKDTYKTLPEDLRCQRNQYIKTWLYTESYFDSWNYAELELKSEIKTGAPEEFAFYDESMSPTVKYNNIESWRQQQKKTIFSYRW